MNLLFYFENEIIPTFGGTERATENLAIAFSKRGHHVFYLSRRNTGAKTTFPNYYLPNEDKQKKKSIEDLLIQLEIDVIFNQAGNTDACLFFNHHYLDTKARIITCLHFSPYQGYDKIFSDVHIFTWKDIIRIINRPYTHNKVLKLFRNYYREAIKYSDAFVVLSDSHIQDVMEISGTSESQDKIYSIPNINSFVKCRETHTKENHVLYVGRLQYNTKRLDRLLDIWKIVDNNRYSLDILGDGPERKYYEDYAKKLNLHNVTFYGYTDPQPFYEKAKIITLTSTHESFGMTLIEGMSYGCVPIAFDTYSAVKEIISDGQTGFIIPPFNKIKFSEKILLLLENDSKRISMAENALNSISKFDSDIIMKQWQEVYNRINSGHIYVSL